MQSWTQVNIIAFSTETCDLEHTTVGVSGTGTISLKAEKIVGMALHST